MAVSPGIFRQYDIRGIVDKDLTIEAATAVGRGYAAMMRQRGVTGRIVVSRDNRPSGEKLRDALVDGLTTFGVDVVDIGVVATPLNYWALHHLGVAGGIQITGSHNPPEYNGFKLSMGTGSLHGEEIQKLYGMISTSPGNVAKGKVTSEDVIDRYIEDVVTRTGPLPKDMKVVYDCGNGAASLVAPQLFERLGIDAHGIFCESDGTFPNHHPDPTVPENLEDLIAEVKKRKAQIGIAFDGDGDRIGVVDDQGTIIWGDRILIMYARDVLERTGKGQPIIFDVKCSQALSDAIEKAGGKAVMWKTGHSLIKDKMKETHAPVAGEMSGHMFFSEGFYGHDDALYGAARLLRILAGRKQTIRQALADVPDFVSTPEIRIEVPEELKFGLVDKAVAHFRSKHDVIDVDGVRVLFGDGWGLIRASNTQPVIVARYEAQSAERLAAIRGEMEGWLREQGVRL
ncbi:MAG TPA: phosphomannomutase/phosphoglucomutase [Gemmatimonadaceae bacterium]|nr:phosphomannomutase/phosphoglucomutase [Gemmatimonadaceae bacterium]